MNMTNNEANCPSLIPLNSLFVLTYVDNTPHTTINAQNTTLAEIGTANENIDLTHLTLNSESKLKFWTVNSSMIDFKIDLSSEINVLPKTLYNILRRRPELKSTTVTFTVYNNNSIPIPGKSSITS